MTALQAGSVIAGRYRLDRPLAKGGMGAVWIGHHLQLDIGVAIKVMTPELARSPEARARFEREAKASAQLRTANAVHVYDFGIEGETPFLVMELLEGEDLEAKLAREGRLSPAATWSIVEQVLKGLRRAHEVGLVHRDLKPANIFLSRRGAEQTAKILDFGIAKTVVPPGTPGATRTGALMGSPHYMSPEQVRSTSKVDLRSDLWAVGVIVFRCLTGQLPFPGDEVGEVLVDVCTKPIPVVTEIAPWLRTPGTDVDRFFAKALSRDPAQRFQSVDELESAFSAFVLGAAPAGVAPVPDAAPATAPLVQQTVLGPAPVIAPAPAATLSPSSQTYRGGATAANARGSMGIVIVAIAGALLLGAGLVGIFVFLRQGAAPPPAAMAAPSVSAAPPGAPTGTQTGPDSAPSAAASASGTASAAPSSSASTSAAPGASPPKSQPGRNRPTRKGDDLLNHI